MLFQDIHFSPLSHLNKSPTRMAKSSPGYLEQIHLTGWWPGHKESSKDVVKQQGAMFAYEFKPRLRIGISQNVGSPLFGSVFYIPPDAMHKVHIRQWKKKNVQHLRRRQQLRSCHTFASQLLGESDRPSQPCHVHHQVEGHVAKACKSTQKQPSLRTNLQGLAAKIPVVSVNTVPVGWVC